MKCNIKYIGKSRQGITKYYCTIHKSFAYDKLGNKLNECLCNDKEIYDNKLNIKENNIKSIKIIYENILENVIPKIIINDTIFNGTLEYDDCILTYKDLGGILLSRITYL